MFEKRIDIITENNNKIRAYVYYTDKFLYIEYAGKRYYNLDDNTYKTIVVSDETAQKILKEKGLKVRGKIRNRESLHITLDNSLLNLIKSDADYNNKNITNIVENILLNHYRYK